MGWGRVGVRRREGLVPVRLGTLEQDKLELLVLMLKATL